MSAQESPARHMCVSKAPFASRRQALQATRKAPGYMRAYRCPACGHWHTTSKRPAK